MSVPISGQASGQLAVAPVRRVREEFKDGLAVMAFSAVASTALAVVVTVLAHLVG